MITELESRVSRKLMLRIIPFVMLLYFVSFLDRVNVGFAALSMNKAIGLSPTAFGLGGGLFFIGYFLLYVVGATLAVSAVVTLLLARQSKHVPLPTSERHGH
jgi:ACS family tartrate transporter-like MFS transporter